MTTNNALLVEAKALKKDIVLCQRPLKFLICLKVLSTKKYMTANEIAKEAERKWPSLRIDITQAAMIMRILSIAGYVERIRKGKYLYRRTSKPLPTQNLS